MTFFIGGSASFLLNSVAEYWLSSKSHHSFCFDVQWRIWYFWRFYSQSLGKLEKFPWETLLVWMEWNSENYRWSKCYKSPFIMILAQYFYKRSRSRFMLKWCWSCISTFYSKIIRHIGNVHDKDVHYQNSITNPHSRMKIPFSPRVFPKNTLNGLVKIEFSYEDSESVEGF